MSGAHEGCSQGKSVRDREGSKHSTAATLERVDSQAAVLPQAFKDRVHARQLAGVVQESGAKDESSRFGTLTFNMTHASERGAAARKSQRVTRIAGVEKFVGSRFTPTCNTSVHSVYQFGFAFEVTEKSFLLSHRTVPNEAGDHRAASEPPLGRGRFVCNLPT